MNFSNLKSVKIDEVGLVRLSINGVQIWKKGYKNWVLFSTEDDDKTIYNGGVGYKDNYRIRSGGAEIAYTGASCTGFIPVKGGDVMRMSGYDLTNKSSANAINVYDGNHVNLGQAVANTASGYGEFTGAWKDYNWSSAVENPTGVLVWMVPPDARISYIRVTGYTGGDGRGMVITKNEEIQT